MADTANDNEGMTVVVRVDGKAVRLGTPAKWTRAVRAGDLKADTEVEIERHGTVVARAMAAAIPQLAGFFETAKPAPEVVPSTPGAPESELSKSKSLEAAAAASDLEVHAPPEDPPMPPTQPAPPAPETTPSAMAAAAVSPPATPKTPRRNPVGPVLGVSLGILGLVILAVVLSNLGELTKPAISPAAVATAGTPAPAVPAVPAAPAGIPLEMGKWVEWDAAHDPNPAVYSAGDLTITLFSRPGGSTPKPVIRVEGPSMAPQEYEGQEGLDHAMAGFGIGQLDPATLEPELLFASFSGGAHCCTNIEVLERVAGTWKVIELGAWDGGGPSAWPTDVDGDKTPDIVVYDNSFLYAFAPYSDSFAPPAILNVVGGKVSDVSTAPRYRPLFRTDATRAMQACLKHGNGACAAFVADASRLDQTRWAWDVMLANYDQASDWVLPTGCQAPEQNGTCPPGAEIKFDTYPEALMWFLKTNGYVVPAFEPITD